jgi:hypothetical protein
MTHGIDGLAADEGSYPALVEPVLAGGKIFAGKDFSVLEHPELETARPSVDDQDTHAVRRFRT